MASLLRLLMPALIAAAAGLRPEDTPLPSNMPPLPLTVQTTLGPVTGVLWKHNVRTWLAIPYAAPPVGTLRFRDPRPAAPWTAPRDCSTRAALTKCPQLRAFPEVGGGGAARVYGEEDCL